MTINLADLPMAVRSYLDNKVQVTVELKQDTGNVLNPGEACHILVSVKNAAASSGGIALTNVRYQLAVRDPAMVKFFAPPRGKSIDIQGQPIAVDTLVGFFTYNPDDANQSYLSVGETNVIRFNGRTGGTPAGGSTTISVRIQADPDINAIFPRNENSTAGVVSALVVPT